MSATSPSLRRGTLLLLLAAFIAVWFGNLEYRKLVRPDEGRYAEISREMAASGDWTTPRLNGVKYFEKPALQYWATAAAYTAFGEHHWTTRLWPALTGFLGILMVGFAGRKLFGATAGLYAAAVLAGSLLYVLIGHINTLDMGVSFFMGLGLCGFLLAHRPNVPAKENRLWMHVTWAALAFSVLSKGLIGLVLPGAVLVLYTLMQRDWRLWTRLHLVTGLLLFFAITVPWFVAVSLANPEFFHFFFIHEHFERFLTRVHGRYEPWHYFVPILLAGMLPWVIPMFDALARAWKTDGKRTFQPKRFLLVWSVFIYFFFSISDSKLSSYILPIFPALALLIGERLTKLSGRALFWQTAPLALLAVVALGLAPEVGTLGNKEVPNTLYQGYAPWVIAAAGTFLGGTLLALYWSRLQKITPTVLALGFAGLVASQLILSGHDALSPASSAYHLVPRIQPHLKPGIPFYSVGMYEQTLPFYIKRTVTVVEWQGELEFGLQQEPDKWIPKIETFKQRWREQPEALAIMSPHMYSRMAQEGLPMEEIARDTRRVVVKKP